MKKQGIVLVVWLLLPLVGCVSQSKSQAQANAAFLAGQNQALREQQRLQAQAADRNAPAITFRGPVRYNNIPWIEGMTLSKAIFTAEYTGIGDPRLIILHQQGEKYSINPAQLLTRRDDPLLLPGDFVEIWQ